jgi:hypothetical protein
MALIPNCGNSGGQLRKQSGRTQCRVAALVMKAPLVSFFTLSAVPLLIPVVCPAPMNGKDERDADNEHAHHCNTVEYHDGIEGPDKGECNTVRT